ncbi:hypothetical protein BKH13_10460 [Actinomyces naeslundii]|jgi:hypothetical protein avisC_05248|uniref:EccD-like transmembrane domain-containing protein n=1 Tax=Actinomyces naeslundii TaxID=1655 RepID=A0ABX3EWY8_ACTNA|nr:hypothetical protein [Actinomyces naeslundii]OLO81476.1 hypothetical protein BKH13_10460 [Actinomyces naeslundii]OLO85021.1 hypothetical protein BKH11_09165 [Actinomyces naeslundii]OLO85980.1 hypothetical protein BKH12_03690 [Actinomyces naeslundii]OLO89940.1 hypothetical protein BKH10_07855 [Actinomyces naeslundii]OMG09787.1 hypothetical protein BKH08_08670 [Actinomyces naeslundii]
MNATSIRVTLVHEGERLDVAARAGVSVGELIPPPKAHQPSGFLITTADGAAVDAEAAVGTDVLEGAVLVTTPARAGLRSHGTTDSDLENVLRSSVGETAVILVAVLCFFLGGLPPLIGHGRLLPTALQIAGACLLMVLLVAAAFRPSGRRPAVREALGALTVPLAGGAAGALLAPVSSPDSRLLVALLTMWGTGVAALVLWIVRKGVGEAVSAGAWLFLASVGTMVPAAGISRVPVLVVLVAVGAIGGLLIPGFAVRVPNQQLLDMTQLRVMGRSVRQPEAPVSQDVSPRLVSQSVDQTAVSSVALEIAFGSLVLLGLPTTIQAAMAGGVTGWGARVELVCVMVLLLLRPRTAHSRVLRLMPRLVVAMAVVLVLVLFWVDGGKGVMTRTWSEVVAFIVFLTTAGTFAVGMFLSTVRSAWWGRLGDIFQALAALGTLPAAVIAAGLIDVMRQL